MKNLFESWQELPFGRGSPLFESRDHDLTGYDWEAVDAEENEEEQSFDYEYHGQPGRERWMEYSADVESIASTGWDDDGISDVITPIQVGDKIKIKDLYFSDIGKSRRDHKPITFTVKKITVKKDEVIIDVKPFTVELTK